MTLLSRLSVIFLLGVLAGYCVTVSASEVAVVSQTQMLAAQSVDETASTAIGSGFMSRCRESAVYVEWATGVTSGVVQVESARNAAYTGTWAPLATVTFAGTAPNSDLVQITGIHSAIRTRISTVVAGSTVSTWLTCN